MLAKPHAWLNLFGPGHFTGLGLPVLLIVIGCLSSLAAAVPAYSLVLLALAMATVIELFFILARVFTQRIQSAKRFSAAHVLRFVRHASHILSIISIMFPLWIVGVLFLRLFQPPEVETKLVLVFAASMLAVNCVAAFLLESTIYRHGHFASRFGLFKKLLIPSCIALIGGTTATLIDADLLVDDIGALLIMGWFMSSARLEDLGV